MDFIDLAPSLKRAVAPPGEFDQFFPNTTDDDLAGSLADGVAEAQLDGFLSTHSLDLDAGTIDPALSNPQQALIVLYARARVLQARLSNLKSVTRYKAGNVEAETQQAASVLVELLRESRERKKALLDNARWGSGSTSFSMVDMYVTKSIDSTTSDVGYLTPGWQ